MYRIRETGLSEGAAACRQIVFDEEADGHESAVALWSLAGSADGPTMVIVGGQHGVELNGPVALHRALRRIAPEDLSGRILAVPMANPAAFVAGRAHHPDGGPAWSLQTHWPKEAPAYPPGERELNMNRLWPGRPDGSPPERIADAVHREAVRHADFCLDLHCHFWWNSECVIVETTRRESVEFGRALGCRVNHLSVGDRAMLSGFVAASGVPVATVELVPTHMVSQRSVDEGVRMIRNALIHAGMLRGEPDLPEEAYEFPYDKEVPLAAARAGLVSFRRAAGEVVGRGEMLAEIIDPWTFTLAATVEAPYDCLVSRAAWNSWTGQGWPVCKVVELAGCRRRTSPSPPER